MSLPRFSGSVSNPVPPSSEIGERRGSSMDGEFCAVRRARRTYCTPRKEFFSPAEAT